jgi:hypothetical protein
VADTCNPSYSRGRDQENQGLKPAHTNSVRDQHKKGVGRMAQVIKHLRSKRKVGTTKKKKKKKERNFN